MNIIAIVVTYNRAELLKKVLVSLTQQTQKIYKIIVVDNDSKDDTSAIVKNFSLEFSNVIYFNTGDNLGGAGGFYQGFKLAENYDYDYLWLMDDDFLPTKECLYELVKDNPQGINQPLRYDLDESCAEISPVNYDLAKIFCRNPKLNTVSELIKTGVYNEGSKIEIAGVPFEGPLISRGVVSSVGYPNPDFFIFNDDLDYSIRTRNKGYSIKCVFSAKAYRLLKNNQVTDLNSWKGYFMLRNHFYILRAHGENFFVVNRSLIICFYYIVKSIMRLDFKFLRVVINSYLDSFNLKNSNKHRP